MRLAILVQNGHFGRAALGALLAQVSPKVSPALILEGCAPVPGPGVWTARVHRLLKWLGAAKSESFGKSPLGRAIEYRAEHQSIAALAPASWKRLMQKHRIDALACLGFPTLIPQEAWSHLRVALNAHPSLLPRWRGPSPIFWWLRSGEPKSGVTIHQIVARADAGPIFLQRPLTPFQGSSGEQLATLFGEAAGGAMAVCLDKAATGQLVGCAQRGASTWARRPRPEDAFISPTRWPGERLLRFIHGAGLWQVPRIEVGETLFFARTGLHFEKGAKLPADFVLVGDALTVPVQDGTVSMVVQQEDVGAFA